jgi:hypothetical protein
MPITELTVNINKKDFKLRDIIFDKTAGIIGKLPKTADGLRLREAINQLVVPVQQTVLQQANDKVARRSLIRDVASEHVAAGGALPKVNRGTGGFTMVGQGTGPSALRQGALGSTAPTSSLITNEGFTEAPKTSFNEIAQRLPKGDPSYAPGLRMTPPRVGIAPETQPVTQPLPATQSNNYQGPETFPERQAAYRDANRALRPRGVDKLRGKIYVPGTGMAAVENAGRNLVRGIVRSPRSAKVGTGVVLAGGVLKGIADNYAANKIVNDVVETTTPQPTTTQQSAMNKDDQLIIDDLNSRYQNLSQQQKLARFQEMARSNGAFSANARIWLKYNAPNK